LHQLQRDLNSMTKKVNRAKAPCASIQKKKGASLGIGYLFSALLMLGLGVITPPLLSTYHPGFADKLSGHIIGGRAVGRNFILGSQPTGMSSEPQVKPEENGFIECSADNLAQFISNITNNPGVHIFCFSEGGLTVYRESQHKSLTTPVSEWSEMLEDVIYGLVQPYLKSNTQPFAFFSVNGRRLVGEKEFGNGSVEQLVKNGMVLLYEGGGFVWPGIRIGFKRIIPVTGYVSNDEKNLEIETLSVHPLILSVKEFISENECDHIIKISGAGMEYSEVSLMDKDKGRPSSDFRTSQSFFLEANDEVMHALETRTASLTRIPKTHQEHTQVLRYGHSEKYDAHLDYFDAELYKEDPAMQAMIDYGRRNRLATVFWYLSDVEEGGHTIFPRFNGAPQPWVFDDCTKGLKVKPEKGKVIVFYNMLPNGDGDPLSLHGACPVEKGIKWAANKWIWNHPMIF